MGDSSQSDDAKNEQQIEVWKIKKLIKSLEAARGNGTSMISLILPPKDQISRAAKMLADEFGTASNIKSRVNRLSVLSAITSTQQRLKLFTKVPPNGLVIYCGTILTDDNKEKKVNIDFEPFKPINTSLYLCDNKFHTEVRPPRARACLWPRLCLVLRLRCQPPSAPPPPREPPHTRRAGVARAARVGRQVRLHRDGR